MGSIARLEPAVRNLLRSQVVIPDVADVVKELVENSIDSGATEITCKIRLTDLFQVYCKDNGRGMEPEDLNKLGKRYYTSKWKGRSLDALKDCDTFGFRGEALSSIIRVSSQFDATSKVDGSYDIHTVTFKDGLLFKKAFKVRSDCELSKGGGTSIVISNLFSLVPARLAHLSKIPAAEVISKVRGLIFNVSVLHPTVKIKMYLIGKDNNKESLMFVTGGHKSDFKGATTPEILRSMYGMSVADYCDVFEMKYNKYEVTGIISSKPVQDRSYQFVFINNRLVRNVDLIKNINKRFQESDFAKDNEILMANYSKRSQLSPKKGKSPIKIVGKPFTSFPLFVFFIRCPQSVSDLIQDPAKNIYESDHLKVVEALVQRLLKKVLAKNGINDSKKSLTIQLSDSTSSSPTGTGTNHLKRAASKLLLNSKVKSAKCQPLLEDHHAVSPLETITHNKLNFNAFQFPTGTLKRPQSQLIAPLNVCDDSCEVQRIPDNPSRLSGYFQDFTNIQLSFKDMVDYFVVGQVDKKFILIRIEMPDKKIMAVIDQHACDERIKLESLLKDFMERSILAEDNQIAIPVEQFYLDLNPREIKEVKRYSKSFDTWGIKFVDVYKGIKVTHLPEILSDKIKEDLEFLHKLMIQHCIDLREHEKLKINGKKRPTEWWNAVQYIPRAFIDIFNSKACRSAIMFGDELSREECCEYVEQLKKCVHPFQCAHGRPSIVPLVHI